MKEKRVTLYFSGQDVRVYLVYAVKFYFSITIDQTIEKSTWFLEQILSAHLSLPIFISPIYL